MHELGYALYLDHKGLDWQYEEMQVPYVDNMTGKWRIYVIDFTVTKGDEVMWVEIKPKNKMIPLDKRVWASRRAEESGVVYRGMTDEERRLSYELLSSGYAKDKITFLRPVPRSNRKQISYYFTSEGDAQNFRMEGWHKHTIVKHSAGLVTLKLRRND
jgi:hypothetical protein